MQRGRATQEQLPSAANAVATSKATGIKRPALSMSRLKHYDGKEVIFSYLNHATKQYSRFSSKVEDFMRIDGLT